VAYVALNKLNQVAVIDAKARKILRTIPVGMAPFGVAIAKGSVFVANRGGRAPKPGERRRPV
jgi:YVTN family beta-propeller protein